MNIRLVKPGKVREINIDAARPFFKWSRSSNRATAADAAPSAVAEFEMPTVKEPQRLLLSSWTYPEPRTDLAIRE